MIHHTTLSRYSIAALLAALAVEPTLAQASTTCSGPKVAWGSISDTSNVLLCGFTNRGRSFGGFTGAPRVPIRLSAELFNGIHALALSYNSAGTPVSSCIPFDGTKGDGPKFVEGAGCLGLSKHQVVVVF